MRALWLVLPLTLAACATGEANHLGNPLTWPGMIVQSTVSNAVYDARRGRVSAFVATNQTAILQDARAGGGASLDQAMALAGVPEERRAVLTAELAGNPLYAADAEALVVALMVHGGG